MTRGEGAVMTRGEEATLAGGEGAAITGGERAGLAEGEVTLGDVLAGGSGISSDGARDSERAQRHSEPGQGDLGMARRDSELVQRESGMGGGPFAAGYLLGIGDVVVVNVWREPVLSGETFVRNDGMISINLLGDVQAAGRTPMELRDEIQSKLSEYIESPVVTVTLKNPTSQKYYVIGEVKSPGEYDLVTDLTFLQAIARAGGFTDWASRKNVVVIRHAAGGEERIPISYDDILKGKIGARNILLRANDTIVVP